MITAIAAVSDDGKIGHNDDMLWRIPKDFKWYKTHTTNNIVLVGRKTFEVLPVIALKNRTHIVVGGKDMPRKPYEESIYYFDNISEAFDYASVLADSQGKEIYVGGGSKFYETTMEYWDQALITWVSGRYTVANKSFPVDELLMNFDLADEGKWQEDNGYHFQFCRYIKQN